MNGIHLNGKAHSSQKPIPGCLGRMVNLFDFASNTAGNRMITEKPHREGSSISRSRSDISRSSSPIDDEIEDKVMISELKKSSSGKNAEGISMKMLIDKEMSKDLESRNQPPNVVAKLMGLDALPRSETINMDPKVIYTTHYLRNSHPDSLASFFLHENNFVQRDMGCEVHRFHEQNECRDVHQMWLPPQRSNSLRDTSPWKAIDKEYSSENKMTLVRQKFMELKRLAMDENRHESKEFHDALEVLNSHKDEFVTLLHEQNSMFSQHLYMGLSVPLPEETKRITVLRPSKLVFDEKFSASGKNSEKRIKQEAKVDLANGWGKNHNGLSSSSPALRSDSNPTQPTRIVVLKPSTRNVHDFRAVVSSAPSPRSPHHRVATVLTPSSPRYSQDRVFLKQSEDDEAREAREVAKEITLQMRANLASLRRDETLISSVFSSGYNGDESSFNKSETEFATGYVSDTEAMSPASRQSWDYVDKENSPYSSSFNRASCSPKSSVCREAKKRLSERWALTSAGSRREIKPMQAESGTLGEMLALSDVKRPEIFEHTECNSIQGPRGSTSCVNSTSGSGETGAESPRSLPRSKSLPLQSTDYSGALGSDGIGIEISKTGDPKDSDKTKTTKLSFAAKVTSFFSPRSKKSSKEKKPGKPHSKDESALPNGGSNDKKNIYSEGNSMSSIATASCSTSLVFDRNRCPGLASEQAALHVAKPATYGLPGENQDQPSPISVLDPPFEEEDNSILGCSRSIMSNQGKQLTLGPSNLIGKSPPIGSIARTLSWDDHSRETASCYSSKSPFPSPSVEEDEDEWLFLVQSLLTAAGLDDAFKLGSTLAGWHSLESPLDPSLREKYVDLTIKEPFHEAKRRQLRSNSKLVFDFVNAALLDSSGSGSSSICSHSCTHSDDTTSSNNIEESTLADSVWALMKEWVFGDVRFLAGDEGNGGGEIGVVDRVVVKEVVGKGWADELRSEVDEIGKEIEGKLLEELMVESVTGLTNTRL